MSDWDKVAAEVEREASRTAPLSPRVPTSPRSPRVEYEKERSSSATGHGVQTISISVDGSETQQLPGNQRQFTVYHITCTLVTPVQVRLSLSETGSKRAVQIEEETAEAAPAGSPSVGPLSPRGLISPRGRQDNSLSQERRAGVKRKVVVVKKRYSDFLHFHQQWRKEHREFDKADSQFTLPQKKWFWSNFKTEVIRERQDGLHNYIQLILSVPILSEELYKWLGITQLVSASVLPVVTRPRHTSVEHGSSQMRVSMESQNTVKGPLSPRRPAPAMDPVPESGRKADDKPKIVVKGRNVRARPSLNKPRGSSSQKYTESVMAGAHGGIDSQQGASASGRSRRESKLLAQMVGFGKKKSKGKRRDTDFKTANADPDPATNELWRGSLGDARRDTRANYEEYERELFGGVEPTDTMVLSPRAASLLGAQSGQSGGESYEEYQAALFKRLDKKGTDELMLLGLLASISIGDLEAVKAIAELGVNLNAPIGYMGHTAATWAAYHKQEEIADYLLSKGAKLSQALVAEMPGGPLASRLGLDRWQSSK